MTADEVAALLGLEPLPHEGGLFAETFRDAASTAIYYLLAPPDFSGMHRLSGAEVFHHYAGAPVRMLLLPPDGAAAEPVLGQDLAAGERPQVVVAGGVWQGAWSMGEWSLLGTTMAPGFEPGDFELGDPDELSAAWPDAADRIRALSR